MIPGLEAPDPRPRGGDPGAPGPTSRRRSTRRWRRRTPSCCPRRRTTCWRPAASASARCSSLLSGYFGDPSDPRLIPASVSRRARPPRHAVPRRRDRRGGVAPRGRRRPTRGGTTRSRSSPGDYLFARASEMSAPTSAPRSAASWRRRSRSSATGRSARSTPLGRLDQTEANYLEVIRRKTAALIATSCRLGGMLSDAPPEHVDVLDAFGESLGLAFQLSDDIMDITSSQLELGKEPGRRHEGGRLHAPGAPRPGDLPASRRAGADPDHGASEGELLDRALEIVADGDSIEHARTAVRDEVARAVALVERLPSGPAQHALVQLARFLAVRCGADGT